MRRLVIAVAVWALCSAATPQQAPPGLTLSGDVQGVHDPAVIRADGTVYLFTTSHVDEPPGLIHVRTSRDLQHWTLSHAVFDALPAWATERVPGTRGLWAPDIVHAGNEYRLYYSVSTFGKNDSAIGLAVTPTLDPAAPGYGWVDKGPVLESGQGDDFNAIDPNILIDADGSHWMSFGSFWTGIKTVRLDPATGLRAAEDRRVYPLARRPSPGAVEAPFVIRRDGAYYLFVSFDFCCRRSDSTYYTVVGRADSPTGPFRDRDGRRLRRGGGLVVLHADLDPSGRFVGPGHPAVASLDGHEFIFYHAYDTQADGVPTLRIQQLAWSDDGWPVAL